MTRDLTLSTLAAIDRRILTIRGERVMLDVDLAEFYGVATKRLNEQVSRNLDRFPDDFMFKLTPGEKREVVAKCDHLGKLKYSKALPRAFSEHGAIMAAAVLNSPVAVDMSVYIVRAFVRMRQVLLASDELRHKVEKIERHLAQHDQDIRELVQAVRQLMLPQGAQPQDHWLCCASENQVRTREPRGDEQGTGNLNHGSYCGKMPSMAN